MLGAERKVWPPVCIDGKWKSGSFETYGKYFNCLILPAKNLQGMKASIHNGALAGTENASTVVASPTKIWALLQKEGAGRQANAVILTDRKVTTRVCTN